MLNKKIAAIAIVMFFTSFIIPSLMAKCNECALRKNPQISIYRFTNARFSPDVCETFLSAARRTSQEEGLAPAAAGLDKRGKPLFLACSAINQKRHDGPLWQRVQTEKLSPPNVRCPL